MVRHPGNFSGRGFPQIPGQARNDRGAGHAELVSASEDSFVGDTGGKTF